ncbi:MULTISPECIES: thioesterase domain-containing protein [unclassified Chryseobacterium]|uniref:thioesterase II family protein n=1 Tax=unclassified Chryseobacterium TaxID=2593645 RepID=UPI000F44DDA5|nr:thioesterase domain-containing protein [Chryseobacterium sp. G0240]ROI04075.1 thioesterase [Chryseobacterium sp. G0240]
MKIISFHFAGGNQYSFNKIFKDNKNHLHLELQRDEGDLEINHKVNNFIQILKKNILDNNSSYIIYGHSMGALIGYLVCQKLQEENLPLPKKLIVSGKKVPSIPRDKKVGHLPDNELWKEVVSLGGIPDEMQNYPELIDYYLPILRHDFRLVEGYQYEKKPKLKIPIDVFYGSEEATEEEMIEWNDETTEKVTITQLPGNHFFIFNHVDYFRTYFDNIIHQR